MPQLHFSCKIMYLCQISASNYHFIVKGKFWHSNFIVISLQHVFSPVNLLDILRTLFPKNTSRRLLLHLGPDLPMVKLLNECLGANNLRTYLAYAAENSCLKYVRIGFLLTRILQYSHIPYPMKNVRFLEKS